MAAAVLAGSLTVGTAMAYFTTYTSASGQQTLDLGFVKTEIKEEIEPGMKHITIPNTNNYDCYIRAKVFCGDKYKDHVTVSSGNKWALGDDGYYYYSDIVPPNQSTEEFLVKIDTTGLNEDFHVVVVQESTAVLYDADGNPYGDWTAGREAGQ